MKRDIAGGKFGKALDLGRFRNRTRIVRDSIGGGDRGDMFKINLVRSSYSAIALTGLRRNADIALFDENRNLFSRLENKGRNNEITAGPTPAGIYYIKVYPKGGGKTDYELTVFSVVLPNGTSV